MSRIVSYQNTQISWLITECSLRNQRIQKHDVRLVIIHFNQVKINLPAASAVAKRRMSPT